MGLEPALAAAHRRADRDRRRLLHRPTRRLASEVPLLLRGRRRRRRPRALAATRRPMRSAGAPRAIRRRRPSARDRRGRPRPRRHGRKFPAVAFRIDLFVQQRRIMNFLAQKLRRNVGTARKQQTIHFIQANISISRVPDFDFWMLTKNRAKPFCVLRSYPRGQIWHRQICDFSLGM